MLRIFFLICMGFGCVSMCVCVCFEASAQLDLPGSGVVAALRFLSLTGNRVLLSASPDAAP